jgi:HlyD family secretion protein
MIERYRQSMARIRWKTLIAAAVVIAAAVAAGLLYQQRPLTIDGIRDETNLPIKVFGLGTIEARVLSKVGFKVAGTLIAMKADHGDHVTAGQLLAAIDGREQQARAARAKAQMASAQAAVQVAEAATRRSAAVVAQKSQTNRRRQSLLERQVVSVEAAEDAQLNEGVAKADLLVAQSEVESTKAKLDDAKAQHDYENVILSQHELRAPFDGIVVARTKELGAVVGAGEALFTIVAPETVWVLAYVDEARVGDVRLGMPAEIKLRSLPQTTFKGRVARIGIESDRVNEERRVYVSCETCPEDFFLGEQAEVFITTAILEHAVMVPQTAIEQFDGATGTVWTVEHGVLRRRTLSFGKRSHDGRVEVTGGLSQTAVVASRPATGFREGGSVRVQGGP